MNRYCQFIVFSNKAYNAIIDETIKKDPIETGGILLGHVLDNGTWIVMEVLPPGIHSTHQYAYFEYDEDFVNYLANSVASKYEQELSLLGLWHRHPGSMDYFSGTDDGTNAKFAAISPCGAISGLVNVDPKFRLTMRHVSYPLQYDIVDFEVGDDIIPESYFELKHFPKVGLHPVFSSQQSDDVKKNSGTNIVPTSEHPSKKEPEKEKTGSDEIIKKDYKKKLLFWVEKALMIIGIITLLYLLFVPSKSKQIEPKEKKAVEVKKQDKSPESTVPKTPQPSKENTIKDNKKDNKDGRVEKKKKDSNNKSSGGTGIQ